MSGSARKHTECDIWKITRAWYKIRLQASYTVEAAGVMAVVFLTMMVLLNQAFHIRAETVGSFQIHEMVEKERHEIIHSDEKEITHADQGKSWSLEITSPVFRPEEMIRMWSMLEEKE